VVDGNPAGRALAAMLGFAPVRTSVMWMASEEQVSVLEVSLAAA
jgi:hypothetical protein